MPRLEVFNKIDQLDAGGARGCAALYPGALTVSALTGDGRDELVAALESRLALDTVTVTFEFDPPTPTTARRSRSSIGSAASRGTLPPTDA